MSRDFDAEAKRGGGATDPLKDVLRRRSATPTTPPPAPAVTEPAAAEPRPSTPRRKIKGTTRSWYLHLDVANDLSSACDTLYFDLRGTREKAEILGVLIRVGLNNMAKVRKQLGLPPAPAPAESEQDKQPAQASQ